MLIPLGGIKGDLDNPSDWLKCKQGGRRIQEFIAACLYDVMIEKKIHSEVKWQIGIRRHGYS